MILNQEYITMPIDTDPPTTAVCVCIGGGGGRIE